MDNLVLVGFSCSGKTTTGRYLARRLGMHFTDTDQLIEEATGRDIPEIFREDGEAAFRILEHEAVTRACSNEFQVISTGGGAFAHPASQQLLKTENLVVHLEIQPETVAERLRTSRSGRPRPLLDGPDPLGHITDLMDARRQAYALAHVTLLVDNRSRYDLVADISRRWYAWRRQHRPDAWFEQDRLAPSHA